MGVVTGTGGAKNIVNEFPHMLVIKEKNFLICTIIIITINITIINNTTSIADTTIAITSFTTTTTTTNTFIVYCFGDVAFTIVQ